MNREIPRFRKGRLGGGTGKGSDDDGDDDLNLDEINFINGVFGENAQLEIVFGTLKRAILTRRRSVNFLNELARAFDRRSQDSGQKSVAPCAIGAIGGLVGIGAGAVTICTGGAAVPVIAGLTWLSAGLGIGGAGWNIMNNVNEGSTENELVSTLKDIIRQDLAATRKLEIALKGLAREQNRDMNSTKREVQIILNAGGATAATFGSDRAFEVLAVLQAGGFFLTRCSSNLGKSAAALLIQKITKAAADEYIEEEAGKIAQAAAKQAVSKVSEGFTKKAANSAAFQAAKKAADKALKEVGEEVTEEAAKEIARKAARDAARKVAKEAAEEAAEGVLKTAAKVTGGVTVCFGAVSAIWEGRNAYKAYQKSVAETCEMGDCLREIVGELQRGLNSLGRGNNDAGE